MSNLPKKLQEKLASRIKENANRSLPEANNLIDFSSNDYLGFAKNEDVYANTFQSLLNKGISHNGSTGSRLISGNHVLYADLERFLIKIHEVEDALVFNSGYNANIGFFESVPQRNDVVFYDELIHASIREGIVLGNAKSFKFNHNSLDSLKEKVERTLLERDNLIDSDIYVVTESVFSMDGDSPNLKAFAAYCVEKGCYLVVDEAHALGVIGKKGFGLVQELQLQDQIFARIITFGKALGCHGAAILGSKALKEYLLNFARSFIYTTALPPHSLASVLSAYNFLNETKGLTELKLLKANIELFKAKVDSLGLTPYFIESDSSIQSCLVPGNNKVKSISEKFVNDGFNVKAILSPTVSEGEERLRFCLHSFNSKAEINLVIQLLAKFI